MVFSFARLGIEYTYILFSSLICLRNIDAYVMFAFSLILIHFICFISFVVCKKKNIALQPFYPPFNISVYTYCSHRFSTKIQIQIQMFIYLLQLHLIFHRPIQKNKQTKQNFFLFPTTKRKR